jgi:hypothetical protein
MIEEGKSYTNDLSAIGLQIDRVLWSTDEYVDVLGTAFNKKNKLVYDTREYRLYYSELVDWFEIG